MNSFMMAFGWASIMLLIGFLLRAKIAFFRTMLVPSSVIGGIIGLLFLNVTSAYGIPIGTDEHLFTEIVTHLFTISIISIGLTSSPKDSDNSMKNTLHGALGMGIAWCLLYAITPIIGVLIVGGIGRFCDMPAIYGTLIPYAFAQGPGQAASYGALYEGYGYENAGMTALTFSVIGFIIAFAVGIPMARLGVKRGIAKHCGAIDETTAKGYLTEEKQTEYMVKDTTCCSNIETMAFHFTLIGLCYILAVGISKILALIPGFIGASMSGLMFMNGMYAACLVKWIMKKAHLEFLHDSILQSKITGWSTDYLVVCAFMAVSIKILGEWLGLILVEAAIVTAITFVLCFYFGQRIGGKNDFERTLGLFGTCTGTIPSGMTLVRIVDPQYKTSTAVELGMMNLVMLLATPATITLLAAASGTVSLNMAMILLAACCLLYIVLLKLTKTWGKCTYTWKGNGKNV